MPVTDINAAKVDLVDLVLRLGRQPALGTVPTSLRSVAKISESIRAQRETVTSEESFPDRMQGETKEVGLTAGGSLSLYLRSTAEIKELLSALYRTTIGNAGNFSIVSPQVTFDAVDNALVIDPIHQPTQTTGNGLSDLTAAGTYNGTGDATFEVEITVAAATDEFRWRKNGGAWSASIAITGAAQALSDGVTVTFAATTGHTAGDAWTIAVKTFAAFKPFRRLRVRGAGQAGNNTRFRIADSELNTQLKIVLEYGVVTAEAAGASITIDGQNTFIPRSDAHYFTAEREYPHAGGAKRFLGYEDLVIGSGSIEITAKQFVRVNLEVTGRIAEHNIDASGKPVRKATSLQPTHAAASTGEIFDASNNMRGFRRGGLIDGNVKALTLSLDNQSRYQDMAQTLHPAGVGVGTATFEGNLQGYLYLDDDRLDNALGYDDEDLSFDLTLADGSVIVFELFRFHFTEISEPTGESGEGDAMLDNPFRAERFTLPDGEVCYGLVTFFDATA